MDELMNPNRERLTVLVEDFEMTGVSNIFSSVKFPHDFLPFHGMDGEFICLVVRESLYEV
jgi:hypothetical protein